MGWLYKQGYSRSMLIESLLRPYGNESMAATHIRHACRGNVLWVVWQTEYKAGGVERWIACYLMAPHKGYGWGYKDMEEDDGPYYYTCPKSFLDMAPATNEAWRKGVMAYHNKGKGLKIGETITLKGTSPSTFQIVSLRPLKGAAGGVVYRIPKRYLACVP